MHEIRELSIQELDAVAGGDSWIDAIKYYVVDKIIGGELDGDEFVAQAVKTAKARYDFRTGRAPRELSEAAQLAASSSS